MKSPRVVNWKTEKDKSKLFYIGRKMPSHGLLASPWANPFKIDQDTPEARQEVLAKYRDYITGKPDMMDQLDTLAGKTLACWCWPKACHGDVLVDLFRERFLTWPEDADPRTKLHFHLCVRGCYSDKDGLADLRDRDLIPAEYTRWDMIPQDIAARAIRYYGDLLAGKIPNHTKKR